MTNSAGHRDPTTPSRFDRFQLEIVNKISARHRDFTTPGRADQFHLEIVTNLPKTQQTPLLVTRFDPSLSFSLISPHFQPSRHTFITNNTHFHPSSNTSTRLGPPSLISEPLPAPFTNFYQFLVLLRVFTRFLLLSTTPEPHHTLQHTYDPYQSFSSPTAHFRASTLLCTLYTHFGTHRRVFNSYNTDLRVYDIYQPSSNTITRS